MEKVARKKAKRALKKRTLFLLLLATAAAAWGGARLLRQAPALPEMEPWPEAVMLLEKPQDGIVSLSVARRDSQPYLLVKAGDAFALSGREDVDIRPGLVNEMLAVAEYLQAENTVIDPEAEEEARANPADFGLDDPWLQLTVGYADGTETELCVGNLTPNETPQRYCTVSGLPGLYTALSSETDAFDYDMDALRDFDQPGLDGTLMNRIDVSGNITLGMYYTPVGWYMDAPLRYPLNAGRVDALLSRVSAMAFETCLGEADEMDLAAFGLDDPALTVRLTQAATVITGETAEGEQVSVPMPETEYTLLLGDETGRSGVYLIWDGRVFKASNFLLGFWKQLDFNSFLLQSPVNFLISSLTRVSVEAPGIKAAYAVEMVESITENNLIATDDYGRVLYDCEITREGEAGPMDAQTFLNWYVTLAALSPDGRLPEGYQPAGESRGTLVIESGQLRRVIGFYPFDALHDALMVDGVAVYYISRDGLNAVLNVP